LSYHHMNEYHII